VFRAQPRFGRFGGGRRALRWCGGARAQVRVVGKLEKAASERVVVALRGLGAGGGGSARLALGMALPLALWEWLLALAQRLARAESTQSPRNTYKPSSTTTQPSSNSFRIRPASSSQRRCSLSQPQSAPSFPRPSRIARLITGLECGHSQPGQPAPLPITSARQQIREQALQG